MPNKIPFLSGKLNLRKKIASRWTTYAKIFVGLPLSSHEEALSLDHSLGTAKEDIWRTVTELRGLYRQRSTIERSENAGLKRQLLFSNQRSRLSYFSCSWSSATVAANQNREHGVLIWWGPVGWIGAPSLDLPPLTRRTPSWAAPARQSFGIIMIFVLESQEFQRW